MKDFQVISVCCLVLAVLAGCNTPDESLKPAAGPNPEDTIGSVSEIFYFEAIPLRGIGLVAGLNGKGSSECPPRIRRELEKYIWKQISAEGGISPQQFIASKDTAVVEVFGVIPSLVSGKDTFDVTVRPLTGTQTVSLKGGHLYTTELKELSRLVNVEQFTAFSKSFATVQGPIFANPLSEHNSDQAWFVLGGAKVLRQEKVTLLLNNPDFIVANTVRNRINERFGGKTAVAISDAQIDLNIPTRYHRQKDRFLKMLQSLQLGENFEIKKQRIEQLVQQLVTGSDKDSAEIALEAIGRQAANSLAPHLESPDESVRFRVGRCMLNSGDDRSISTLRDVLMDPASSYRLAAIEALSVNGRQSEVRSTLIVAVNDVDINVRLAAYEALLRTQSPVVSRKIISSSFTVDSVACSGPKMIYVFQQQTPRIVIFGSPVYCRDDIFVQSEDGNIIVNAKPGDKFVSVSRKHPRRHRVVGPIKTGHEISHLIQSLGERPPLNSYSSGLPGLAIPYDEIAAFIKKMCDVGVIDAQFVAGPPAEVDPMLKDLPPIQD
ncbi:MAG: flagellar basal body P-ring protein FlgI [Planctomycetota bacterium]|jgi:flagellar basal body P-ring protein FlgI